MKSEKIDGTYVYFYHDPTFDKTKTQVWDIFSKEENEWLGRIMWFARWRTYAFSSTAKHNGEYGRMISDIVFEQKCLKEIADFCDKLTNQHKELLKNVKA